MIIVVAGKNIKGAVTITVPSDEETAHSVAPISSAPSGA